MKTSFRWAGRLTVVAAVAVVVVRILRRVDRSGKPSLGGDTWPPVPVNPDRHG
jgi:hypothetical protein